MGPTRDELANALRGHRAEIVEADEWRPLADHVLALIELEVKNRFELFKKLHERVMECYSEVPRSIQKLANDLKGNSER